MHEASAALRPHGARGSTEVLQRGHRWRGLMLHASQSDSQREGVRGSCQCTTAVCDFCPSERPRCRCRCRRREVHRLLGVAFKRWHREHDTAQQAHSAADDIGRSRGRRCLRHWKVNNPHPDQLATPC